MQILRIYGSPMGGANLYTKHMFSTSNAAWLTNYIEERASELLRSAPSYITPSFFKVEKQVLDAIGNIQKNVIRNCGMGIYLS